MTTPGTQGKKKDKTDVDPLYERRRWRRRSTTDFRHATAAAAAAANVAIVASRSERQLPVVVSDSEDSSGTPVKSRRDSGSVSVSINANANKAKGSIKPRPSTRFRRAASRSFRGIWQGGIDGAHDPGSRASLSYESCLLAAAAPHLLQMQASPHKNCVSAAAAAAGVVSRFAMRRHAVMEGIRERIAGLRRRAGTAPGMLEWGGC